MVERGNRIFKENLSNIFREKKVEFNSWCFVFGEVVYKKNIVIYVVIKEILYVVVFGIKSWKEINNNDVLIENNEVNNEIIIIVTRSLLF